MATFGPEGRIENDTSGKKPYQTWPDPIVYLDGTETWAKIRYVGDGFELSWTDGVANDWSEVWPQLDVALMRLAMLANCGRHDWDRFFATHDAEFYRNATAFTELCDTFFAQNGSDM